MRLEALNLAVQYYCNLPASVPNNPNLVLDTAEKFVIFLSHDLKKSGNSALESGEIKSKNPNLKGPGQPHSGS